VAGEREAALGALLEFRKDGSWPDLYLKKRTEGMDSRQAALVSAITYGVVQNTMLIDFYISQYSSLKMNRISPYVLEAMRMAVYQMLFLDRIPDNAAVNETIKLVKKTGNQRAAGFANGVLRQIGRTKDALPPVKGKSMAETLSIKYSHPLWMVKRFISLFGADGAEQLLKTDNAPVIPTIRVNTLKTTATAFAEGCEAALGHGLKAADGLENAFYTDDLAGLLKSPMFERGEVYVQDAASQHVVALLAPRPGERLMDICAAPGGKSLLAAQLMEDRGEILSNDIYPHKVRLIEQNAEKYGVHIINTACSDASYHIDRLENSFDRIICDVPCSGLGIIRKKPDIRYKDEKSLAGLPALQASILENAASYLKTGGRMIYTTCTILPEENENVVRAFLAGHRDFALVDFSICGKQYGGIKTFLPHVDGTDGFFAALLERRTAQ